MDITTIDIVLVILLTAMTVLFVALLVAAVYFVANNKYFRSIKIRDGEKIIYRGVTHLVSADGIRTKEFSGRKIVVTDQAIYIGRNFRLELRDIATASVANFARLRIQLKKPIRQPLFTWKLLPRFDKNGVLWLLPGIVRSPKIKQAIDQARGALRKTATKSNASSMNV